ncbi:MAG: carboxypeptidase-like regulatory domain-containing protein [Planctomycetota bacterium]
MHRVRQTEAEGRATRKRLWIAGIVIAALIVSYRLLVGWSASIRVLPLTVVVRSEDQQPIAGVEVSFIPRGSVSAHPVHTARTAEDGKAVLPAEKARGEFYCLARLGDGRLTQGYVWQGMPAPETMDFGAGTPIQGRVRSETGLPIENARVEIRFGKKNAPLLHAARSGPDGSYRIEGIAPTLRFLFVRTRAEGYAVDELEWSREGETSLDIELSRAAAVRIQVLLPDGRPARGIPVQVKLRPELARKTGTDGRIDFLDLHADETLFLHLEHETFTYRKRGIAPEQTVQVIRLQKPAALEGRVQDAHGAGIEGVELRHPHGPRAWVRTQSDRRGRFRLGDLPQGPVEIFYETRTGKIGSASLVIHEEGGVERGFVLRIP